MAHSQRKRKREHRRKLEHQGVFFRNGYSTNLWWKDEAWGEDNYREFLRESGFSEAEILILARGQGQSVIVNDGPIVQFRPYEDIFRDPRKD